MSADLQTKAGEFAGAYLEYFAGQRGDMDLMQKTTQPLFYGLRAEKKRLEANGLSMITRVQPDRKSKLSGGRKPGIILTRQGNHLVGSDERPVHVTREFYRNGSKIYGAKSREIQRVRLLNSNVNGKVECPNCGYVGDLASFLDGCDYCKSKFLVEDFEPKVSSYTFHENLERIVSRNFKTSVGLGSILALLIPISFVMAMLVYLVMSLTGQGNTLGPYILVASGFCLTEPTLRLILLICLALFLIRWYFTKYHGHNLYNSQLAEKTIPGFSSQDFFQNVEMRLNQIYLSEKVQEVSAYADCDLQHFVNSHLDVVDSHLVSLKFLSVTPDPEGFLIKANAVMRLFRYSNGKIKKCAESVNFTLRLSGDAFRRNTSIINVYHCQNCGNSVDILKGGVCDYCKTRLSLQKVGMRFASLESRGIGYELGARIIGCSLALFLFLFAINLFLPNLFFQGMNTIQMVKGNAEDTRAVAAGLDEISLPEDFDNLEDRLVRESGNEGPVERKSSYEIEDQDAFLEYCQDLEDQGYVITMEDQEKCRMKATKFNFHDSWGEETDWYSEIMTYTKDGKLKVVIDLTEDTDTPYEDLYENAEW